MDGRKQKSPSTIKASSSSGAFDPTIPEEGPSAPPPGWLDTVQGYQGHTGAGEAERPSRWRTVLTCVFLSPEDEPPLYPPPPAYTPQPEADRNTLVPDVR